jgi:putative phage-type endonuclease
MHPQVEILLDRARELPVQRSDQWFKDRNTMVTASEVASVLGKNKYQSYKAAIKNKVGSILGPDYGIGQAFKGNIMTEWGNSHEDSVRDQFCLEYNQTCHETGCLRHPVYPFMGASPDGILESGALLEIKCPYLREPLEGYVPEGYYEQMQMQMEVCDLDSCYYVEWKPKLFFDDSDTFQVQLIKRDPEWLTTNLETISEFWAEVSAYVADPEYARETLKKISRPKKLIKQISGPQFV